VSSSLKEGWEVRKLGEVCEIYNGSTPLRTKKEYWEDGTINWFTINDIRNQGRVIEYTRQTISENGFKNSSLKILPINTILLCCTASVGEYAITKIELTTNQQFNGLVIKDTKQLLPKFLYYFSSTLKNILLNLSGKATIDFVSMTKLKKIEVPVPPLKEQEKIVALLDEAFLAMERAKTNAELNLQNAKELFESYLQAVFENRGEGWEEKNFDEICVLQRGFDLPKRLRVSGDYPLMSSNGETDRINIWKVKAPGVITGRSGTIGKVHFIKEDFFPLNTSLYIKEFHGNYEEFIYYFLKQFNLEKYSSGAGVPTLNRNNVHCKKVWFIKSKEEQKTIVKKLNTLQAQTEKLESIYTQKLLDLKELKKSILQKAFNGELI